MISSDKMPPPLRRRAFIGRLAAFVLGATLAATPAPPAVALARGVDAPSDNLTTFTLAQDAPARPLPEPVFGTNVEWIRAGNGLWNAKEKQLDGGIIRMSRDAGITLIRFPGGVWSDFYNWRDGVGPHDKRPETKIAPKLGETSRHDIGTDEIAAFAKAIGAKLMITVNAGHGTPEEAAAWAAYVRDTHGADIAPYWEIGNELYMADDLSGGSTTPEAYAARVRDFAAAIRKELPQAKIAAIGLLNYGPYRFNAHDNWNEVVLARAGDVIDVLAIHNSYAPLVTTRSRGRWDAVYRSMLAAPQLIAKNMRDTAAQIDRLQPARAGRIGLAITEWGPFFAVDPTSPYFDHIKTLGSGVFVARTLDVFLRDTRVEAANFFKLSDWLNMGWINHTPGGGFRETPALLVFGLYREVLTDAVLPLRRESGPTFSTPEQGFTGRVDDAPAVDGIAGRQADGRIGIMLSNADLTRAQQVAVRIEGAAAGYRAQVRVITGPSADAHRGTAIIEVPGVAFAKAASFGKDGWFIRSDADTVGLRPGDADFRDGVLTLTLPPASVAGVTLAPLP